MVKIAGFPVKGFTSDPALAGEVVIGPAESDEVVWSPYGKPWSPRTKAPDPSRKPPPKIDEV